MKTTVLLCLASFLALSNSVFSQDAGNQARLEATGLYGGTTLTIRLHSTEIGQPAAFVFGHPTVLAHLAPNPVQLVSTQKAHIHQGVIGTDGELRLEYALPSNPIMPGKILFGQGVVWNRKGFYQASSRIAIKGETHKTVSWTDAHASLPTSNLNDSGSDVEAFDYDRDGDQDLLVSNRTSFLFYTNDGSGSFTDETATRLPANNLGSFVTSVLDVDLDGDLDFVTCGTLDANGNSVSPMLFTNNGVGVFTKAQDLLIPMNDSDNLIVGDLNCDGWPDVMIGAGSAYGGSGMPHQLVSLFLNQSGTLVLDSAAESASWNSSDEDWLAGDCGDVDRDGDLDLYFAMTGPGGCPNILLLNDGTGSFTDVSATHLPNMNYGDGDKSSTARLLDMNGDGWLDVVVANSHLSMSTQDTGDLLLNSGASAPGLFVDAPNNWLATNDPELIVNLGLTLGDVDMDGDNDIILHPSEWFGSSFPPFVGHPTLFLNQGGAQGGINGEFVKDAAFWTPGPLVTFFTYYGALFDADSDGDLDFYTPSYGGIVDPSKTQDYLMING